MSLRGYYLRRYNVLDMAWRVLYRARWPNLGQQKQAVAWFDINKEKYELIDDWQQKYWETHLQEYVQ